MTTYKQQAQALVQKSWAFQKRNIGTNICLCVAPIFFCVVLALIQVAVNVSFLSSDNLKCGCFCQQCCPKWALSSAPGNYTSDGQGKITIVDLAAFGGQVALDQFPPSSITNVNGVITIQTCGPIANGPCPEDLDYTCLQKDDSKCGIQFSTPSQAQWCPVPSPSAWPPTLQVPDVDQRASPWGKTRVNGTLVPRAATLVTGADAALANSFQTSLFPGRISTDDAVWAAALQRLYSGNASNPAVGNIYNGDQLSVLGLLFGTSADVQTSLYFEEGFLLGQGLFVMLPVDACVSKGISATKPTCLAGFLKKYFAGSTTVPSALLAALPNCTEAGALSSNSNRVLSTEGLRVICTENVVVPTASATAVEDMLYCGYYQARCNLSDPVNNMYVGAYDLRDSASQKLDLVVYYNETRLVENNNGPPTRLARLPGALSTAIAAWWAHATGGDPAAAGIQLLGVMSTPKQESKLKLDFSSLLGPLFYCWVVQLLLPTFLQQLVYEKEKRLRMMMKMHGLGDAAYWTISYLWYLLLYVVYIAIFIIIGAAVRLKMFYYTNLGIQIIFYFLFGNCMIAFAFMLSSLFTSSRTAVVVAFLYVFATGLIGNLLLEIFMDRDKSWLLFVEWIPAWALYRGLYEMSTYTFFGVYKDTSGLTFSKLSDPGNGMVTTWIIFVVEWALFLVVGLYLEQVLSSGTGIRRRPLFFMEWLWRKREEDHHHQLASAGSQSLDDKALKALQLTNTRTPGAHATVDLSAAAPGLSDVEAERERVLSLESYEDNPIVVKDIKKVYPGQDGGKPKLAVRSMTLGIQRGECFGLLGPNGAGKTTSINMLTGFLEPTAGTGIVEGYDIRADMRHIYKLMGVCPQHDLLWGQLSAREHLRFYGRLKGLNGQELEDAIDAALKSVNLYNTGVGDKQAGKYSGGMKRRLSVAISFIGAPRVVYLDEPSTGLDPASRRNLWEVVKSSKAGRSIILTTHSMEEAEQLCDRLGIFVDGQLVCIGAPKEITSRYAGFYVFTLSVPAAQEAQARDLVTSLTPHATLTYSLGGTLKYELPSAEVSLAGVFKAVKDAKAHGLNIIDWGVANATLEEVFIKLAKGIGATSADK